MVHGMMRRPKELDIQKIEQSRANGSKEWRDGRISLNIRKKMKWLSQRIGGHVSGIIFDRNEPLCLHPQFSVQSPTPHEGDLRLRLTQDSDPDIRFVAMQIVSLLHIVR